jgi:hypothetical protein
MSVLDIYRDVLNTIDENTTGTIDCTISDNIQSAKTAPMVQEVVLLRKISSVKVIRIRRQLTCGTYDLDERLDAVLERILDDITP